MFLSDAQQNQNFKSGLVCFIGQNLTFVRHIPPVCIMLCVVRDTLR